MEVRVGIKDLYYNFHNSFHNWLPVNRAHTIVHAANSYTMIMDCSICPYLMDQTVFHKGEGVLIHRLLFLCSTLH